MPPLPITEAVRLLRAGEVVALPTETVYGLAADGLNVDAVARIFAVKERPTFDPLILHLARPSDLAKLVTVIPPEAEALARAFWPGGLTLVLPKRPLVPDLVTSGLSCVAVRCPAHPVMQTVLRQLGRPLAAPSANRFGRISPTDADAVREELGDRIPLILDGGPCPIGIESTIVDLTRSPARLLRAGAVPLEAIQQIIPCETSPQPSDPSRPVAPGLLASHYAPRTPLFLARQPLADGPPLPPDVAALIWSRLPIPPPLHYQQLTVSGSDLEAAAYLFRAMRALDASGVRAIYADPIPMHGLGRAIHDRLTRASHGTVRLEREIFWEQPATFSSPAG
ncbi:MAG: L-threonylcarbamoyladenylate synthase [Candidatus Methylacidiphilales bacterium]